MTRSRLALAAAALSAAGVLAVVPADAAPASVSAAVPVASAVRRAEQPAWAVSMLKQVNAVRAKVGARPLVLCPPLMRATAKYALLMATTGHFDHVGPDGSEPWDRGRAEGYRYRAYGENIAEGQDTVKAVMDAWVHSPGHYANLIGRQFTHLGVGHAVSDTGEYGDYWVQNFGAGGRC